MRSPQELIQKLEELDVAKVKLATLLDQPDAIRQLGMNDYVELHAIQTAIQVTWSGLDFMVDQITERLERIKGILKEEKC